MHCIKGVSPRFWSKFWKFLLSFYFIQNRQGKCVWQYPSWKKETLHTIKKSILKTRKTEFFQRGVSMVLVKKFKFLCFYFGQKSKENVSKKFFIAKKGFPGNDKIFLFSFSVKEASNLLNLLLKMSLTIFFIEKMLSRQ